MRSWVNGVFTVFWVELGDSSKTNNNTGGWFGTCFFYRSIQLGINPTDLTQLTWLTGKYTTNQDGSYLVTSTPKIAIKERLIFIWLVPSWIQHVCPQSFMRWCFFFFGCFWTQSWKWFISRSFGLMVAGIFMDCPGWMWWFSWDPLRWQSKRIDDVPGWYMVVLTDVPWQSLIRY